MFEIQQTTLAASSPPPSSVSLQHSAKSTNIESKIVQLKNIKREMAELTAGSTAAAAESSCSSSSSAAGLTDACSPSDEQQLVRAAFEDTASVSDTPLEVKHEASDTSEVDGGSPGQQHTQHSLASSLNQLLASAAAGSALNAGPNAALLASLLGRATSAQLVPDNSSNNNNNNNNNSTTSNNNTLPASLMAVLHGGADHKLVVPPSPVQNHHHNNATAPSATQAHSAPTATPKRKRQRRNPVWPYFEVTDGVARCKQCPYSTKSVFSTNLKVHLRSHHRADYEKVIEAEDALNLNALLLSGNAGALFGGGNGNAGAESANGQSNQNGGNSSTPNGGGGGRRRNLPPITSSFLQTLSRLSAGGSVPVEMTAEDMSNPSSALQSVLRQTLTANAAGTTKQLAPSPAAEHATSAIAAQLQKAVGNAKLPAELITQMAKGLMNVAAAAVQHSNAVAASAAAANNNNSSHVNNNNNNESCTTPSELSTDDVLSKMATNTRSTTCSPASQPPLPQAGTAQQRLAALLQQQHQQQQAASPNHPHAGSPLLAGLPQLAAAAAAATQQPQKRRRLRRHPVWTRFFDLPDRMVGCIKCDFKTGSAFSTNLKMHLRAHHKEDYYTVLRLEEEMRLEEGVVATANSPPSSSSASSTTANDSGPSPAKQMRADILEMIRSGHPSRDCNNISSASQAAADSASLLRGMFAAKHETTATTTTSAASDPSTTHDRLAALVAMASSSSSSAVKDEPCVPSEGDLARAMQDLQRAISAAVSSSSSGAPSTAAFTDCQAEPALPTCPRDRALARFWIDQGASDSLLDNKHFKDSSSSSSSSSTLAPIDAAELVNRLLNRSGNGETASEAAQRDVCAGLAMGSMLERAQRGENEARVKLTALWNARHESEARLDTVKEMLARTGCEWLKLLRHKAAEETAKRSAAEKAKQEQQQQGVMALLQAFVSAAASSSAASASSSAASSPSPNSMIGTGAGAAAAAPAGVDSPLPVPPAFIVTSSASSSAAAARRKSGVMAITEKQAEALQKAAVGGATALSAAEKMRLRRLNETPEQRARRLAKMKERYRRRVSEAHARSSADSVDEPPSKQRALTPEEEDSENYGNDEPSALNREDALSGTGDEDDGENNDLSAASSFLQQLVAQIPSSQRNTQQTAAATDLIQALAPDYSLPTASALMQIATTQSHDHPSHE